MPIVETLTVTVGASVAKWIIGEWVGDGLRKELAAGFADVLASRVPDFIQRRGIRRQMDQIAESSAVKLARLVEAEFQTLDDGEQRAAVHAASDALDAGIGLADISALDYDPVRLKERLVHLSQVKLDRYGLSSDAERLYNLVLTESANYIVEVASTLPNFATNASVEILRRESALIEMVREIYAKLPDPRAAAEMEAAATAEFETDYRRYLARRLDRLELFGLSVSEFSSRYALSVAYITLSVKKAATGYGSLGEVLDSTFKPGEADEGANVRVDDAIGSSGRVFVRGAAGSGKTTLLQWIAVNSARSEFQGSMEGWNGAIPFFLQLRRFHKSGLPEPSDFLAFAGPGMLERAPEGWVSEQLSLGRAILLIDGVDEVAESDRNKVRKWLDDLIATYPNCRYVVTSRPAAVAEDWLTSEGFDRVDLQPMTMSDIGEFVAHWHHAAARNATGPEQLGELGRYQSALTETIAASRQIRSLATTPLLCAMLCALNRDRRTQLPKDRVELYRIALEMLLERRDIEREVGIGGGPSISLPEKLILLRELAYWLVLNEQSDAEYEVVIERFGWRLKFMPGMHLNAESVLKYMLVRSGLLREPVQGRIDFIHRTFQEYLAAVEVSELGNIPMLVARASEDNWREVVILAAGTCHSRQKSELFEGLLRRGREEPEHQHTLYLLAVACLETAREVPPSLAEDIGKCLNELLPPKNVTEAKELASAGELALSRLGEYTKSKASEAAACVRTACLIGGEASLQVLANFSSDARKTVQRELLRGWALHDRPRDYAERVLHKAPLVDGVATITDPSLIPFVDKLTKLQELKVTVRGVPANLNLLRELPQLTYFDARGNSSIADLSFLSEATNVRHLDLERCSKVHDISPLAKLTDLQLLDLSDSKVRDISVIARMERLSWLSLAGCRDIFDWEPLRACSNIMTAYFSLCLGLPSLDFASGWTNLRRITADATSISSLTPLANLRRISRLAASYCPRLSDVSALNGSAHLYELFLSHNESLASVESLSYMPALSSLRLENCSNLERLPQSANWPRLRFLFMGGCPKLSDINFLHEVSQLHTVSFSGSAVSDLRPLAGAENLRNVFLDGCRNLRDLAPLAQLPGLMSIDLLGVPFVDLRQLGQSFRGGLLVSVFKNQHVEGADSFKRAGGRLRVYEPF